MPSGAARAGIVRSGEMRVLGHHVYAPIVLLATIECALAGASFIGTAWLLRRPTVTAATFWQPYLAVWVATFALAMIVGLTAVGLYQAKQRLRIEGVLARVIVGVGIGAVSVAVVNFLFPYEMGGRLWATSSAAAAVVLCAARIAFWQWVDHDVFQRRVLVYGAGRSAAKLMRLRRRSDRRGFSVAAFVAAEGDALAIDPRLVAEPPGSLLDYARQQGVDEIVVAMDDRRRGFPISDLLQCKFAGIGVVELIDFLERETGKVNIDLVNPSWLIFSDRLGHSGPLRLVTRAIDILVACLILIVASPVMVGVALAILIGDGLPVLYRQTRVGRDGHDFTLLKFRSMVRNAEEDGARWAEKSDARVTRVGAVLRKLRLDELPQLFNVLAGSMSLVGPRPERPEFVRELAQQIPYYEERHVVKPGITGWAQLSYPYGASEHDAMEKLQYDLYYIKHKSLVFDLMVLLQTAEVVVWRKGAR
jgi:sugar transferase (PEP-CTERM system associated)